MKSLKLPSILLAALIAVGSYLPWPQQAKAVLGSAPEQVDCDSGSTTYTWDGLGIARPEITEMLVDGVPTLPTAPDVGELGATVCPAQPEARFVDVALYYHAGVNDNRRDLTDAMAPDGVTPITRDTEITLTLGNMGEFAEFYTFSLIHGVVSSWSTTNLGTQNATVTVTFTPARTPIGDGAEYELCTATPPICTATQSEADILAGSVYMLFDQGGYGEEFRGSYFAMVGAMGGFVTPVTDEQGTSLVASLGAPTYMADGETINIGSLQAFLPTSVVQTLLGIEGDVDTSTMQVIREETGSTVNNVPFTVTAVTGGFQIEIDDVTFSTPDYTIKSAADTTFERLAGANRIATSIAINQDAFPNMNSADAIVIASSQDFPDALSAGPLAAQLGAPLLINPKDSLDPSVAAEITRVFNSLDDAEDDVYIIGGTAAVSSTVEAAIAALDADIDIARLAGATRIETSVAVARELDIVRGAGPTAAIVAYARNFPDALAASAAASSQIVNAGYMPILLSDQAALNPETSLYISSASSTLATANVVGGTVALSDAVQAEVAQMIPTVNRYAGANRYGTAKAIAEAFFAGDKTPRSVGAATGLGFADALTGGRHSGLNNQPLLLVTSTQVPSDTSNYLTAQSSTISSGHVYGGTAVIPDSIKTTVEAAI